MVDAWLFFFSSRRRHTRWNCDWSSDVCSSDLRAGRKVRTADAGVARGGPFVGQRGSRGPARGFSANAPGQPDFRGAACGNSGMPGEWDAGAGADQSTRIFMVGTLPELWRVGAVRELQYF